MLRAQDAEAVGFEEPANGLSIDDDRELGSDEPGHVDVSTTGVVDEVLGDRPGVLRMQLGLPMSAQLPPDRLEDGDTRGASCRS